MRASCSFLPFPANVRRASGLNSTPAPFLAGHLLPLASRRRSMTDCLRGAGSFETFTRRGTVRFTIRSPVASPGPNAMSALVPLYQSLHRPLLCRALLVSPARHPCSEGSWRRTAAARLVDIREVSKIGVRRAARIEPVRARRVEGPSGPITIGGSDDRDLREPLSDSGGSREEMRPLRATPLAFALATVWQLQGSWPARRGRRGLLVAKTG